MYPVLITVDALAVRESQWNLDWLHREVGLSHGEISSKVFGLCRCGVSLDGPRGEDTDSSSQTDPFREPEIIPVRHLSDIERGASISQSAAVGGAVAGPDPVRPGREDLT